jgi:hypothetical protein
MARKKKKKQTKNSKNNQQNVNIKSIVRDEINKTLDTTKRFQTANMTEQKNKEYNKIKNAIISDLFKTNLALKDDFGKTIASQIIKSIAGKF